MSMTSTDRSEGDPRAARRRRPRGDRGPHPEVLVDDLRGPGAGMRDRERAHPADPGDVDRIRRPGHRGRLRTLAHRRTKRTLALSAASVTGRREEFDTPWPVPASDVCISFIHIPTLFDDGRSQRIFNLINKDVAFALLSSTLAPDDHWSMSSTAT